jgi:hypothetical protein
VAVQWLCAAKSLADIFLVGWAAGDMRPTADRSFGLDADSSLLINNVEPRVLCVLFRTCCNHA